MSNNDTPLADEEPRAAESVLLTRLKAIEADAAVLRYALEEIDHQPVGAYETLSGEIEPCDACGEMRMIAENALRTYAGAALLVELEAARAFVEGVRMAITQVQAVLDTYDNARGRHEQ